jgi:predicted DNA-binding transcriptional regulator AlpA
MSRVSRQTPKRETPADCLSIEEFCLRNRISRQFYYMLREKGQGPTEIRLGARVLISKEAADEWRRRMQEQQDPPPAA